MSAKNIPVSGTPRRAGFTVIEIVVVMAISMIVAAFAVPIISDVLNYYRLRSAVSSATWAIQSTRFQALEEGYPFEVTFSGGTGGVNPAYQIADEPTGTSSYSNVGSSVPLSGSPVVLTAATVVQFQPNGVVTVTQSGTTVTSMQISFSGNSNTITVSNYGNLSITSP